MALILFFAACLLATASSQLVCIPLGPCSCELLGEGTIDLSSVGKVNAPAFPHLKPTESTDTSTYDMNVCYGFNKGTCKNASCCQMVDGDTNVCAYPYEVIYTVDLITHDVLMTYGGDSGRITILTLICDLHANVSKMEAQGQDPILSNLFRFTLTSRCACPGACAATTTQQAPITIEPNVCVGQDSCSCMVPGVGAIDLHSIAKQGAPAWPNLKPTMSTDTSTYSLDVCYGFNDGACQGASCCQTTVDGTKITCGHPTTASFSTNPDTGNFIMMYLGDGARITVIELICDPFLFGANVSAIGEKPGQLTSYYFNLTSRCACPGLCSADAMASMPTPSPPAITTQGLPSRCEGRGPCSCELEGRGLVDLSSLRGNGTAAWTKLTAQAESDASTYSFNMCEGFNDGACTDAACCQTVNDTQYTCGYAAAVSYSVDWHGNVVVTYRGNGARKTTVTLVCDPSANEAKLEAVGELMKGNYFFILTSKCACPGAC